MLMPDQVKPFIVHPDADVRQHAVKYLTDVDLSRADRIMPMLARHPEFVRERILPILAADLPDDAPRADHWL